MYKVVRTITFMAIILYRRHVARCVTKNPSSQEYRLTHRTKRLYMGCDCPLWVTGRIDDREIERQSCGTTDLEEAKRMVAGFGPAALLPAAKDRGPKLTECIVKYIERRESEITDGTRGYYKLVLGWLVDFAHKRNVEYIRDLTVDLLEDFKFEGMPKLADSSRKTYVGKLLAFIRDAERMGWIKEQIAHRVKPQHADQEETLPFDDEKNETEKILQTADGIYRLLLELMLETGLRVSDAINYDPASLERGDHMWIYSFRMIKRKRKAKLTTKYFEVFVSPALKDRIDQARGEWFSEKLPFRAPGSLRGTNYRRVYRKMQEIGETCGIADCRPHRLRDTFAVRKLLAGVSLDDVSKLLGHASVTQTEKSYAAWVPARTRRLEGIVAASLEPSVKHLSGSDEDAHGLSPSPTAASRDAEDTGLIPKP